MMSNYYFFNHQLVLTVFGLYYDQPVCILQLLKLPKRLEIQKKKKTFGNLEKQKSLSWATFYHLTFLNCIFFSPEGAEGKQYFKGLLRAMWLIYQWYFSAIQWSQYLYLISVLFSFVWFCGSGFALHCRDQMSQREL